MGGSCKRNRFTLFADLELSPPRSPGSLGLGDAADPNRFSLLGDTPGSLGRNDCADPNNLRSYLGLHITLVPEHDWWLWDYDPNKLLDDPNLSADFVSEAHRSLKRSVNMGLRPRVHEAYRSPEESDRKWKKWKEGKGGRAAPAWASCHNYGLAMDVYLYDKNAKYIDNHVKGWYREYKRLASAASGCIWGENFGDGDADHFEYHPKWISGADGKLLHKVKEWAIEAALAVPGAGTLPNGQFGPVTEPDRSQWMPFFWWAAGAGGTPPPGDFLNKKPVPN
jgi:hypothetical protein